MANRGIALPVHEVGYDDSGEFGTNTDKYLRYRYLSVKDSFKSRRDEWAERVFPGIAKFAFSDDDTNGLSRSREGYDGLIVGGNDVPRLSRFLKANRNAVVGVVKICLMHGANSQKRAQALMAGFDDVLDTEKMRPEEAVARVDAIARRYRIAIEANNERVRIDREMREIADVDRLTDRERLLLESFLQTPNKFLTYFKIQSLFSSYLNEITFDNAKVIVCNLRKKMRGNAKIVAKTGEGYKLLTGN